MAADGLERRAYDMVVVGGGVAGLAFTLRLPPSLRVALLTKGILGESNTRYAQGGLAAAVGRDDAPDLHEEDTLAAGAGLCDRAAVHALVTGAPLAVDWLIRIGAGFDRDAASGELLLGREAAHSRWRVLHAGGDATGAEIERTLVAHLRADAKIDLYEQAFAVDLIVSDGRCAGLIAELAPGEPLLALTAPVVVLASGGAGQLWATTSNPAGATADGLAMALRAGVTVADIEFMQFHPTVLALPGGTPFLISEAVRGEGAYLRDAAGERFMPAVDPRGELAPRDVVARAIHRQILADGRDHVDLDLRHLDPAAMRLRFPTISRELDRRGLDLATDLIPVAPAAHYFMGGIAASPTGTTSLPGLLAIGEAACTGVHGANRLASNSLLEGLVFGLAAAAALTPPTPDPLLRLPPNLPPPEGGTSPDTGEEQLPMLGEGGLSPGEGESFVPSPEVGRLLPPVEGGLGGRQGSPRSGGVRASRTLVQQIMSRDVGVLRDAIGLAHAAREIATLTAELPMPATNREAWELRNMLLAASAMVEAATRREESRGAHTRADFPERDPALDGQHTLRLAETGNVNWTFEPLREAWDTAAQLRA